jgi:2'-5' RNA ligase
MNEMTKRLFLAVKIFPDKKFREIYQSLKIGLGDEKIKWVGMENVHVTLRFFGDTDEDNIPGISEALRHAITHIPAFDVVLRHAGIFGGYYKPKVIWLGLEPLEPLQDIAATVNAALVPLGYEMPEEPFIPHLTIGRIKYIRNKQYLVHLIEKQKDVFVQATHIEDIFLFESILRPQGPLYNILERFALTR